MGRPWREEYNGGIYDSKTAIGEEAYVILCKTRKNNEQRKRLDEILIETDISERDFENMLNRNE